MKQTVYIETTVVSYYTARPSRDIMIAAHQEATQVLWPRLGTEFETYVSALVYDEASKGDRDQAEKRLLAIKRFPILDVGEDARELAGLIVRGKAIPEEFPEDALHIAICAVNGVQILLTWNFAHLNNPFTRMMVRQVVENAGHECPEICSPNELLEIES